jgi:hypothetical protein
MDLGAIEDDVMKRWMVAWVAAVGLTAGCAVEERLATSPLIGAEPIEDTGEARVLEVLTASRYAYMRLEGAPEGTWHVVMGSAPRVGQVVAYRGYAQLEEFESHALGRGFGRVVFTSLER